MKQYIKKSEGFTLIEMMVVIAVVGILSAAVLAGLAPSRNKAKDARIMSGVQQARAIAETYYDPIGGGYLTAIPSGDAAYAKLAGEINKLNGGTAGLAYTASGNNFAISASLASGGSYCVDSAGTVNNGTSSGGSCGAGGGVGCADGTTRMCSNGTTQQTCSDGVWTGTCPVVTTTGKACAAYTEAACPKTAENGETCTIPEAGGCAEEE